MNEHFEINGDYIYFHKIERAYWIAAEDIHASESWDKEQPHFLDVLDEAVATNSDCCSFQTDGTGRIYCVNLETHKVYMALSFFSSFVADYHTTLRVVHTYDGRCVYRCNLPEVEYNPPTPLLLK